MDNMICDTHVNLCVCFFFSMPIGRGVWACVAWTQRCLWLPAGGARESRPGRGSESAPGGCAAACLLPPCPTILRPQTAWTPQVSSCTLPSRWQQQLRQWQHHWQVSAWLNIVFVVFFFGVVNQITGTILMNHASGLLSYQQKKYS